ncbi:hypothetical protein OH77DRAFT_1588133 [Trametes cingulata]|nr:hypothetical protein OH77DRAFT_1588133 [Trametes cingulata]
MADAVTTQPYAPSGRTPLPFLTYVVLPDVALACVMALRPPFVIKIGVSLILLYAAVYAPLTYTMGSPVDDYSMGSTIFGNMMFNVALFTWLVDPVKDIRYIREPAPLAMRPLFKRIWYLFCLIRNYRLIGTNAQVANVPAPFRGTRSQYVWMRLRQVLVCLVTLDLAEAWIHTHHHLYIPDTAYLIPGFEGYFLRIFSAWVWLFMVYTTLKLSYIAVAIVAVATGIGNGNPEDWPDMFGSWSDAYTVRHLWGRVWHQNLRRHFSNWGKVAVRTLGVPRGTWLSSQVQIHVAFALSGLLHSMGELMLGKEYFGRSWTFFTVNALAITFEDTLFALAKRAGFTGPTPVTRLLGYLWVFAWFTWSAPLYQRWMFECKVGLNEIFPYSLTRSVVLPFIWSLTNK